MKIYNVTDDSVYLKAVVYAHFGAGKTRLAGTAAEHPDMRDVLLARCEDGKATITHQSCYMTPHIRSVAEMRQLFWDIAHKKKAQLATVDGPVPYDFGQLRTLIIDSGTALLQTCLEETVEKNCKKDTNKDPDRVTIRDWGDANFILTKLLRQFFELPLNVIVTALVREDYNTSDPEERIRRGATLCRPDFNPKLANRVMAFADFVWWLEVKSNGQRVLHTQPKGPWVAKTRGDVFAAKLPPQIGDPDLPTIYNLLQEVQPRKDAQ